MEDIGKCWTRMVCGLELVPKGTEAPWVWFVFRNGHGSIALSCLELDGYCDSNRAIFFGIEGLLPVRSHLHGPF